MVNFDKELNLGSRIGQTKNRNLQIKYLLTVILIIFSISLLIALSGVKFSVAIALVLIVFFQILPGSLIWQWTNPNRNLILPELLGMGLALGTLLALLSAQFFRTYGFGDYGWSLPTIVSIVWLGLKRFGNVPKERRLHSSGFQKNEFLVLFFAVLVAIVQVSTWWRWHPLEWVGWWKYQIDVPYIESFSNSIALLRYSFNSDYNFCWLPSSCFRIAAFSSNNTIVSSSSSAFWLYSTSYCLIVFSKVVILCFN